MIQTATETMVQTADKRGVESKIVFAKILKIEIINNKYLLFIKEFVKDDYTFQDENGIDITSQTEREICRITRVRTVEQLNGLIAILKNQEFLEANGMADLVDVYDNLNQLEQNEFVPNIGHLFENNKDLIRGVNWMPVTE